MFDLTKIVIPKVMNDWECIAEALRYDDNTILSIKQNERGDVKKCCREFFKDWLRSSRGTGPKVWSTLLDALKEVDDIGDETVQDITEIVKQLPLK